MVTYLDNATGWANARFISEKSQQPKEFKAFEAMMERQHGVNIQCLRSDGGGEYSSKEFQNYLKSQSIRWEHSAPRNPQLNGRAERLNRTIIEMARCLMIDAELEHRYWQYAATMAVYIRNRTPSTSNIGLHSPYQLLYGHNPDFITYHCLEQSLRYISRTRSGASLTARHRTLSSWDLRTA